MCSSEVKPDVSVIIAAYNVQSYIRRAIESALHQQGVQVEIILVDDASTDHTVAIASSINDPRVKILRLQVNSGPSSARNQGISVASAPWLAILDGDDAYLPDRLMRCLSKADAQGADIVIDNLSVRRESDEVIYPMFRPKNFGNKGILDLATFIKGNSSFLGGISLGYIKPIFSAEFLHRHHLSYDPDIWIGEDYMLLAEALACGARCAVDQTTGYLYTVRSSSISHRLSAIDISRMLDGDKKFLAKYTLNHAALQAQRYRHANLTEALAFTELITQLKHGNIVAALRIIINAPLLATLLWMLLWTRVAKQFKQPAR